MVVGWGGDGVRLAWSEDSGMVVLRFGSRMIVGWVA